MNDSQRQQIRDNARYLRSVRPIDPAEIYEYVEGTPHPGAVRQVLREEAAELALVERADGRFEPAAPAPVSVQFDGVDALPETIGQRVEALLVEHFGPGYHEGDSGDRLRSLIREFKERYLAGATVTYDVETALGYAVYHLPAYYAAIQYVLADLARDGLLPGHLRVLDVGAGVGGPALGLEDVLPPETLVEYHAVEPSEATAVLTELLEITGRNFHPTVHECRIETFDPADALGSDAGEGFDLVMCNSVLSELDDPASTVAGATEWLAADGTVVALAPADRNTATRLREIERAVESRAGATVYAPTVRLWPGEKPESESWSFRRHREIEVPAFQRKLDDADRSPADDGRDRPPAGSGEFVNVDVQYAYSVLRRDGTTAVELRPDRGRVAKLRETERHVTDRVDCLVLKLSQDLSEEGNPLYLVGDGSQQIDHFAVVTNETALNDDLGAAAYGSPLLIENVLVLWNDDERAYNLVVDEETIVDRLPA